MTPPRIAIVPTPTSSSSSTIVALPHPRSSTPTRYLLHPQRGLHEFIALPTNTRALPRSWLLAPSAASDQPSDRLLLSKGFIISDGTLYISTPIDPIFLLLPFLLTEVNAKRFVPLDDLLDSLSESLPQWDPVIRCSREQLEARIRKVSDSADAGGESAYRANEEKALRELERKCVRMAEGGLPKSLEEEFVRKALMQPVTTIAEGTISKPEEQKQGGDENPQLPTPPESQEELPLPAPKPDEISLGIIATLRLRVALKFLSSSYLSPTLADKLSNHVTKQHAKEFEALDAHLKHLKALRTEAMMQRSHDFSLKRANEDDEGVDDRAEKKRKLEEEEKREKKRMSKGLRDLAKVDTKGMAKMTSFFKKKEAKT